MKLKILQRKPAPSLCSPVFLKGAFKGADVWEQERIKKNSGKILFEVLHLFQEQTILKMNGGWAQTKPRLMDT